MDAVFRDFVLIQVQIGFHSYIESKVAFFFWYTSSRAVRKSNVLMPTHVVQDLQGAVSQIATISLKGNYGVPKLYCTQHNVSSNPSSI